jgi:hypothetical protein
MVSERRQAQLSPVVYIMSRFPLLTETFILREMLELERQGMSLRIFHFSAWTHPCVTPKRKD